jgi:subtilisin family serine protease
VVAPASAIAPGPLALLTRGLSPADIGALRVVGGDPAVGFVVLDASDVPALPPHLAARLVPPADARAASVPSDPEWPSQWGPVAIRAPDAWDVEDGDVTVKVAIVDSGIDAAHPDFAGVPIELGTDYVELDATPQDENGHGTHVAGIVAAARDNGEGVAGVANVTLVVVRVLDASARGNCLNVALAILEATARGASVINLSLQCSTDYAPLHLAIQAATRAGVLIVAAGGNVGAGGPCPSYPGLYDEVLAVAALDSATSVAEYSCHGPDIEVAAPGSGIVSTWPGGGYAWLSGTSMAAPHVAGVAALVKAREPFLDGAALHARLAATAVDIGPPGRDDDSGHGRVDAREALGR